jgi:monoamine oxidase
MGMGALSKIGLSFDFARFAVPQGDIFARESTSLFDFDCRPFGQDVVVAIFGGDFARSITPSPRDAVATALDDFVRVAGGDARAAFRDARLHAWHDDTFSLGCYSHCLPGHADARAALREPIGGRLFLAGEASAPDGAAMTTGGAYLAGEAAARLAGAQ